jgi:PAS domain-containing protein
MNGSALAVSAVDVHRVDANQFDTALRMTMPSMSANASMATWDKSFMVTFCMTRSRKMPSEDLYRDIVENMQDGVYFVDRERRITYWNKGADTLMCSSKTHGRNRVTIREAG